MLQYLRHFALLSLTAGSYKYLEKTGLLKGADSELVGNVVRFDKSELGDTFKQLCGASEYSVRGMAALATGIFIWFMVDTFIEYDENGILRFGL